MGALAIALWVIALTGGVFFPPLFVPPIFATFLWLKQVNARQRARALNYPGQVQPPAAKGMTGKSLVLVLAIVGVCLFAAFRGAPNAAPQPAPTDAATTALCDVAKHGKGHHHRRSNPECNPS